MITVKRYRKNPIILPILNQKGSKETCVYNPTAVTKDGKVFLFYRSEEGYKDYTISKINLAISKNGFKFSRYGKNPVISPEGKDEEKGCEDPRVIKIDNRYFLTYTAFAKGRDKKGDYKVNLCGAISDNLIEWEKIGVLIPREKSGTIVQDYKYKGRYVMYFGVKKRKGGGKIKIAFSKNLRKWEVRKKPVIIQRNKGFDNYLVEAGPALIVKNDKILLIYNGKNDKDKFSVGWAIFDKDDPCRLLKRCKKPILEPKEYWERFGSVNNVVYATSLVYFKRKWLLYYGGADKSVGVATIKIPMTNDK
jgi:predicted GH43/DUF377 family glycosyl hydrolase